MAKFLLVDDDPEILKLSSTILKHLGHDVTLANNALEAMDIINNQDFDILISDATMPQFSGFDLLRALQKNERFSHLVKAMLTGCRDKEDIEQALQLGVKDYIVKPIDADVFIEKINRLLKQVPKKTVKDQSIPQLKQVIETKFTLPIKITKISELGITFESSINFAEGSLIPSQTGCDIDGIKLPDSNLKVTYSGKSKNSDSFLVRAVFMNMQDVDRQKLSFAIKQFKAA